MKKETKLIISMSLLFTGTAVGAGILGLPVALGLTGFIPSLAGIFLAWIMLTLTGWLLVHKILSSEHEVQDFADLFKNELGPWSMWVSTFGYMVTFYGVLTAYLSGASSAILNIFPVLNVFPYPNKIITGLFFIVATSIILFGIKLFQRLNFIFTSIIFISFFAMVFLTLGYVEAQNLSFTCWNRLSHSLPILATSFTFHPVIPIICQHVKEAKYGKETIVKIVFLGSSLIFILILLWTIVVLGVLPIKSPDGISIMGAWRNDLPITVPIAKSTNSSFLPFLALTFTFFAVFTSYVGCGAGFMNYMKSFTKHHFKRNKLTDVLGTFLLPLLVALIYPALFISMLGVVGGIGIITVYGFLPGCLAVKKKNSRKIKVLGGLILIFSIAVLLIELSQILRV